jgi:hypothetical protein
VLKTETNCHEKRQSGIKRMKEEKPRIASREAGIAKVTNDFSNPLGIDP